MQHADEDSPRATNGAVSTASWSLDRGAAGPRPYAGPQPGSAAADDTLEQVGGPPGSDELEALARVPPAIRERFRGLTFLGKGGMGVVYRAHDVQLARDVAIKFVRSGAPSRSLREARAQARVVHENVCKIFDVGVADGQPYITMQLVAGRALHAVRDEMSLADKVEVVRQCAVALHEAHRLGLVHRDVKPGNILVERDEGGAWKPYVMDFGLARVAGEVGETATGAIAGTLAYMAPEQARGDIKALDRRSDVFSLGATLFDLLAGRPPFADEQPWRMLVRLEQEAAPSLRSLCPGVPADLDTIVMRCLERDPARRYDSARALGEDLRRYLDGEPVLARPTSLAYRLVRRARRHRVVVSLVALMLVIVAVFAGWAWRARSLAAREAELARAVGEDIKEMQLFMRYAHSLPLHDVERERAVVRARLAALESAASAAATTGPIHAAIGHGYLTLQEPARALEHLQRAQGTYTSPDLEYALGRVMIDLYRAEIEASRRLTDEEQQAARRAELERTYKQPALAHLRAAGDARLDHPALLEGLIALVEERHEDALRLAEQAEAEVPWLFEASMLVAEAHWAVARLFCHDSNFDYDRMMRSAGPALDAYRRAAAVGRSDPQIHAWACRVFGLVLAAERLSGKGMEAAHTEGADACASALIASPRSKQVRVDQLFLHSSYGGARLLESGADALPFMQKVGVMADELAEDYPDDALVQWVTANPWSEMRHWLAAEHADDAPAVERALARLERSLELDPSFGWPAQELPLLYLFAAEQADHSGADPQPLRVRQRAAVERSTRISHKNNPIPLMDRCIVHWYGAKMDMRHGRDPSALLADGRQPCDEMARRMPAHPQGHSQRMALVQQEAALAVATGRDLTDLAARASQILAMAPSPKDPDLVGTAHRIAAAAAAARGESPEPELRLAQAVYTAAIDPKSDWRFDGVDLGDVLLDLIRWQMAHGEVDPALFDEALTNYASGVYTIGLDLDRFARIAAVHERRAAWRISQGEDPRADLDAGFRQVARALERNPRWAAALAVRGALHLLAARVAPTPEARRAAAREARTSLIAALEHNGFLAREYAPSLEEAERLLVAP